MSLDESLIDDAVRRFEAARRADLLAEIDPFLPEGPNRVPALVGIVKVAIELAAGGSERPGENETWKTHPGCVEYYLERYPELRDHPERVTELHQHAQECPPANHTLVGGTAPPASPFPEIDGYEIRGEVSRGAMGVVYLARSVGLDRLAALKMLLGETRADDPQISRFRVEAEAVAAVRHPHVVQVYEFGATDARPYLVMEYLPGGTLAGRLKGDRPFAGPRAAAELVAKIAAGVAAAHDQGIVHRDLKPGNVLFDEAGEPKVADFGLAKRGTGADLTQATVVMGTPAYMSPEQAKGETKFVGPQADVWALGVILYECLAGRRPFAADDTGVLLEKVKTETPTGLRAAARGVPRELDLICRKCLEKEPHLRYPTAAALADDLRNFLDGRPVTARPVPVLVRAWKWARRNRVVAGLGAAAAVLLVTVAVVTSILSWRLSIKTTEARASAAAAAQEAARARQGQARLLELSGTLIFDLHNQVERLPGGAKVQKALVVTALENLRHAAEQAGDDPEVRHALVVAYCKLGDVQGNPHQSNLNDSRGALQSYRTALGLAEAAAGADPTNPVVKRDVMICRSKIGEVLENDRPAEALIEFEAALRLVDEVAELGYDPAGVARDRGVGLHRIGRAQLVLGQTEAAVRTFAEALDRFRQVDRDHPAPTARRDVAVALQKLATAARQNRDTAGANAHLRAAHQILVVLAEQTPNDRLRQRDLMVSLNKLGDAAIDGPADVGRHYREAQAVARRLAADRDDVLAQSDLAVSHERVGEWLAAQGRPDEAFAEFVAARDTRRATAAAAPWNHDHQASLSIASEKVGDMLLRNGRLREALEAYGEGRAACEAITAIAPDNARYQELHAVIEKKVGTVHLAAGRPTQALGHFLRSLGSRRRLHNLDPANATYHRQLALILQDVGDAQRALNRADDAGKSYAESLVLARQLFDSDTGNGLARHNLYVALERVGGWQMGQGQPDLAIKRFTEGNQLLSAWVTDRSSAEDRRTLAISHEKLGMALMELKRPGAVAQFERQVEILRPLAVRANRDARLTLGTALEHLGDALDQGGRTREALRVYEESAVVREALAAEAVAGDLRPWEDLCVSYERLGDRYALAGDKDRALCLYHWNVRIRQTAAARRPTDPRAARNLATAQYGFGYVYGVLASDLRRSRSERADLWLQAKEWFTQAEQAYTQLAKNNQLSAADKDLPREMANQIRRCDLQLTILKR